MDSIILCGLLAKQIPSDQFQIHGTKVIFVDPDKNNKSVMDNTGSVYDTPENRAIVSDVKENYDTLKKALISEKEDLIIKEKLIKEKIRELAEAYLKKDGKLDSSGNVIK